MALVKQLGLRGVTAGMVALLCAMGVGLFHAYPHLEIKPRAVSVDLAALPEVPPPAQDDQIKDRLSEPLQTDLPDQIIDLGRGYGGKITHSYQIAGVILTHRRFRSDGLAGASPLDIGIGWGMFLEDETRARFRFRTGRRNIHWRSFDSAEDYRTASEAFSNTHVIPVGAAVRDALLAMKAGMTVELTGYLIDVQTPRGAIWRSSTRRGDMGRGACEIMLVTGARILGPVAASGA